MSSAFLDLLLIKFQDLVKNASIDTLSMWLLENHKHCDEVVRIWSKEIKNTKDEKQRILLLHLADDLIDKSLAYKQQFAVAFPDVFSFLSSNCKSIVIKSIRNIVELWKEMNIYDADVIAKFLAALQIKEIKEKKKEKESITKSSILNSNAQKSNVSQKSPPSSISSELKKKIKDRESKIENITTKVDESAEKMFEEYKRAVKIISNDSNISEKPKALSDEKFGKLSIIGMPMKTNEISHLASLSEKTLASYKEAKTLKKSIQDKIRDDMETVKELLNKSDARLKTEIAERKLIMEDLKKTRIEQKKLTNQYDKKFDENLTKFKFDYFKCFLDGI